MEKVYKIGIKSGDIGFIEGYTFQAKILKGISRCPFTHAFLFLEMDDNMYVLESKRGGVKGINDFLSKREKDGISLTLVDKRFSDVREGCSIGIRKITRKFNEEQNRIVFKTYCKHHDKPFEKNKSEMIYSWYDGPWGTNKEDISTFFCSEWVIFCLKEVGLLKTKKPCNEFTPGDLFRIQTNDIKNEDSQFYENEIYVIKKE